MNALVRDSTPVVKLENEIEKSASVSGTERSEILNNGNTQHIKTLFNESFYSVACNRCYTAL